MGDPLSDRRGSSGARICPEGGRETERRVSWESKVCLFQRQQPSGIPQLSLKGWRGSKSQSVWHEGTQHSLRFLPKTWGGEQMSQFCGESLLIGKAQARRGMRSKEGPPISFCADCCHFLMTSESCTCHPSPARTGKSLTVQHPPPQHRNP